MAHLYRDFRVVGCAAEHMDGELGLCERIHDRRTSNRYPKGCVCAFESVEMVPHALQRLALTFVHSPLVLSSMQQGCCP
jgi:hypothetical protein